MAAGQEELSATEVCTRVVNAFRAIAEFDCCAVMTVDSTTMLPSGGVVSGFSAELCAPFWAFWDSELLDPDFNKFSALARSVDPVATLADTLDGELSRSPRYQKLYAPIAPADELRVVFVAGSSCLAVGVFLRPAPAGPFSAGEIAAVRELVPLATMALRRSLGRLVQEAANQAPVVILIDDSARIISMTSGAERILEDLRTNDIDSDALPGVVRAAVMKAKWGRSEMKLTTRVRGRSGQWRRLHVATMAGEIGALAVTVENARPGDLVPILLESYGLTERQTDIVLLLCRGFATKEIAAELALSHHTVRDHVKSIYEKTEVSSRGELVAKLFSGHVLEHFHSTVAHVA